MFQGCDLSFCQKLSDAEGAVCGSIVMVQDPPLVLPRVTPRASDTFNQVDEHFFVEVLVNSLPLWHEHVMNPFLVVKEGNEHHLDLGL